MNRWYATLGDFHTSSGQVLEVFWCPQEGLNVSPVATFKPCPGRAVHGKGFTGARMAVGYLWVCHFNMVVRVDPTRGTSEIWLARDDFNDLHDLDLIPDAQGAVTEVLVANTGRDRLDRFDATGRLLDTRRLRPTRGALRTNPDDVYLRSQPHPEPWRRKLVDRVHPNAIRRIGDAVFVSRFLDRCVEVYSDDRRFRYALPGLPHDLVPVDDAVWCTTTDGRVWALSNRRGRRKVHCVLDTHAASGISGWCRGLAVSAETILVGLTRMSTMPRERWCDRPLAATRTGLLLFDRRTRQLLAACTLDHLSEHPKIFSIVPCQGDCP